MRYGLKLVPQGAFPQDVTLGMQLQDEVPVVVLPEPEPCPPIVACRPSVLRFQLFPVYVSLFGGEGGSMSLGVPETKVVPDIGSFGGAHEDNTYDISLDTLFAGAADNPYAFSLLQISVVANACGHRTRFHFLDTANTPQTFYSGGVYFGSVTLGAWIFGNLMASNSDSGHYTNSAPISEDGVLLYMYPNTPPSWSGTVTVQMQIDLTDAAVGSETWTDIGPILHLTA